MWVNSNAPWHLQEERLPIVSGFSCAGRVRMEPDGSFIPIAGSLVDFDLAEVGKRGEINSGPLPHMAVLHREIEVVTGVEESRYPRDVHFGLEKPLKMHAHPDQ